jgi:hypothetical protein
MSKKNKIRFPEGFYSMHSGVPISHEEINEWIKECIEDLESGEAKDYSYIATGNTMVLVEDIGDEEYEVYVFQGYFSKTIEKEKWKKKKQ